MDDPARKVEQRRLANIGVAERSVRRCLRRHLVTSYLPGQVTYNLGEYPAPAPWVVSEEDERLLDEYAAGGIELVQLHEEWNDAERLFGGDKFSPVNPAGLRRFVEMAHARKMRVLLYGSTGFFEERDPDFRREWAREGTTLVELWYRYARCSPASPSWRAYVMPRLLGLMDRWGADGIYDDCGYLREAWALQPTPDEVPAFDQGPDRDGALSDLLALLHAEIHRRAGILKVHLGGSDAPRADRTVYDYLWVGEGVEDLDRQREMVKHHAPYVAPCFDLSRARVPGEDELYLHTIPYLQFPMLIGGKAVTGARSREASMPCLDPETDDWTRHMRAIERHYGEHPEGPHSYGWWDSTPGRPYAKERFFSWLRKYRPLVEEGTRAYLEVTESALFRKPLPADVVASVFANRELWLVLANYGRAAHTVTTAVGWTRAEEPDPAGTPGRPGRPPAPSTSWDVPGRSLVILRQIAPMNQDSQ